MTYDGFTFHVTSLPAIEKLLEHPNLDFTGLVSFNTGQISPYVRAKYKSLFLRYRKQKNQPYIEIRGSFPKYIGQDNYRNMSLADTMQAAIQLLNELGLEADQLEISQLEYGVSFSLPPEIPVNRFIRSILVYKGDMPIFKGYKGGGMMIQFEKDDYGFKIYNKSAQKNIQSNVARHELVVNANQLYKLGIYTVKDMFTKRAIKALEKQLLGVIQELVFYNADVNRKNLNTRELRLLLEFCKDESWAELHDNNPESYRKKKKRFAEVVTKASGIDLNKLFYDSVANESLKDVTIAKKGKDLQRLFNQNEIYSPAYC